MLINIEFMTKNDCCRQNRRMTPKGIIVHSTAAPGVMAGRWLEKWNTPGASVAPHAVLDDTQTVQLLPWDMRGWHAGGSGNDTHIGFEICEPEGIKYNGAGNKIIAYDTAANADYFTKIWSRAVDLCVMLCRAYGLTERDILCHSEGYARGIATNHSDVMHWFPLHGADMDMLREAVRKGLGAAPASRPVLRRGDKGQDVKDMQTLLNRHGTSKVLDVDGVFGAKSEAAVREFQTKKGLAADGVCGPKTWAALEG